MMTTFDLMKMSQSDSEHPAQRRARAVDAAERCAALADYDLIGILCVAASAEARIGTAKTPRARLRLHAVVDALHDVAMRGDA